MLNILKTYININIMVVIIMVVIIIIIMVVIIIIMIGRQQSDCGRQKSLLRM